MTPAITAAERLELERFRHALLCHEMTDDHFVWRRQRPSWAGRPALAGLAYSVDPLPEPSLEETP